MTNANCIDTNLVLETPLKSPRAAVTWRARLDTAVRLVKRAAIAAFDMLSDWQERAHQRRQLMEMDDHMLSDIGISRADAVRESERPFWKI